ncbi:hypothetical protein P175DRAFT_0498048 [Aspergillus ochraceoroseus IBT 24754]|uniref:RING-type domain-containing protein n=1 Tax=Aspergillus ochraceoroseus IBT 24754 TaxID=1392256 RepID=A0A2T5M8T1_9EURO|nr:uncharacterized protein P175DRAFT_0498048 [Aspergillus ochraceoroseus IBT 24754]PTU24943.1 hypothetical protein P175DRAFT_0498048 [Aspergillus ochraceoroseus IBT 24754]
MSRPTPPRAMSGQDCSNLSGTKPATPGDASGLFQTLQGHVDEIRGLLQCGICIRPLYEPFTLACGHTFCYGCLTSWFAEGRPNKTCPDCRAPVKSQPAPAYLVRAVVQLFTSRAELLDKGETTDQHKTHQLEEAQRLETDKKNTNPREGGLFRGIFNKHRPPPALPIIDLEDNVVRCPRCSWELEDDSGCMRCGYRHDDESLTGTDWTESEENSEMTDDIDFDDVEDGFGEVDDLDWNEFHDSVPFEAIPPELRRHFQFFHNGFGNPHGNGHYHHNISEWGDSIRGGEYYDDDDEEEDEEDEDMDSFIDDEDPSEDYDSDSDRSTIVGHAEYNGEDLHGIFDDSASGYSTSQSHAYGFGSVPDSEDMEDELEDEEGAEDEDEDDDEDEEPIRPPIAGNRRRIPTYQITSSSPVQVNGTAARNPPSINTNSRLSSRRVGANPRDSLTAGSSALRAIAVEDDSDGSPVGPVRRIRDRGNCRSSAL